MAESPDSVASTLCLTIRCRVVQGLNNVGASINHRSTGILAGMMYDHSARYGLLVLHLIAEFIRRQPRSCPL
jgi:hypothetical protein